MSEFKSFLAQLESYDINPQYGLGQNFLFERELLLELADSVEAQANARILEIGAGFATLTEAIMEAYPDAYLKSYEIDQRLKQRLSDLEALKPQLEISWGDAQTADFAADAQLLTERIVAEGKEAGPLYMVANLPYYITTELMLKALMTIPSAESLSFMVQAEVWDRIRALPEDGKVYGPLAVFCHLYGRIEKLVDIHASRFYPAPRVNSIFIRLTKLESRFKNPLDMGDGPAFLDFLNQLLAARRKTLMNNLNRSRFDAERRERILDSLSALGYSPQIRAEKLKPEDFATLFYA